MSYTKQTWTDLPSKTTPINASRLTHMEEGIYDVANKADDAYSGLSSKVDKVAGKGLSTNDYDNTAKNIVDNVTTNLSNKISTSEKGANNGVATLNSSGKVPSSQLPSFVDDVIEGYLYNGSFYKEAAHTTLITPEDSKIYVDLPTNKTYRWSGSAYVEISESIALGETAGTAYEGNKGKANADNIAALDQRVTNMENRVVYGFHISNTESDPAYKVSYLRDAAGAVPAHMDYVNDKFDYGSWENAFFMPRPCMLKTDGTVDYYLDPDDYTKKADGVTASDVADPSYNGNAMMEWGRDGRKIWMKIVPDTNHLGASVFIADHKADNDFHDWAFHNCNGESVDHFYTAIYNGSLDSNNKLRSISGQQVMNKKTADNEISYARANNAGANVLWDVERFSDIMLINMLLILMGKSVDTQKVFGEGVHTNGTEAINNTFRTGQHNTKGLFYGTNSGTCASSSFANIVKVFGMENWWGFQWRRYLGHVMVDGAQKVKLTFGPEDGSTATDFIESGTPTGTGFKSTGATALSGTSGNYVKTEYYTEDGMVPCGSLDGTSKTYYCDACWFNNSGVRVPCRGGSSYNGAQDGAFCVILHNTASYSNWHIGAALSCKPLAA